MSEFKRLELVAHLLMIRSFSQLKAVGCSSASALVTVDDLLQPQTNLE